jgi:ParB family chromosome partitioning protein
MRHDSHFVEQLFRPDEIPIGRKIPIHLLEANPEQPRSVLGDLSSLKESIAAKGILEPVLVRKREDGRFTIISGERRFRAALEAGLAEIPCIEMDVADAELVEIALIENLQRKDLTPFEEADGYASLRDRHAYTHEQISKAVGKSRVTVTETLKLGELPLTVKDECRRADIQSKTFLLELSRLPDEAAMLAAIAAMGVEPAFSRQTLRDARKAGGPGRSAEGGAALGPSRSFRFAYAPADSTYRVNLTMHGSLQDRGEILTALRDLLRRIESGEIDLERTGRFLDEKKAQKSADESA